MIPTDLSKRIKEHFIQIYKHFILVNEFNNSWVNSTIDTLDTFLISRFSSDSESWKFRNIYSGIGRLGSKKDIKCVMAYQDRRHSAHCAPIALIQQFFVPSQPKRYEEIKECLRRNVENPLIKHIYLLNEKIYSKDELGICSEKISQVNIGKRITYQSAMIFIRDAKWEGYVALANCDIFFDDSLKSLYASCLYYESSWYALLRYEYTGQGDLKECNLLGRNILRPDSQDVWIYHTAHSIPEKYLKHFSFELGRFGCDTKIIFILSLMKIKAYNEPLKIRIYHYHSRENRVQNILSRVKPPYGVCEPNI